MTTDRQEHVIRFCEDRPMTGSEPAASGSAPEHNPFSPSGVVWSSVSGRLATVRRWQLMAVVLLAAVAIAVARVILPVPSPVLVGAALVLTVGTGWAWWVIGRQVRLLGYAERDEDLLIRRGALFRRIVVVPYGRMQYVDVSAGPLDRALGLARVKLHTASAGTDASIPGLVPDEASRLRDRLSARGQSPLAGL
jgi:membrane protein YdbS with pleckstrin-like domain